MRDLLTQEEVENNTNSRKLDSDTVAIFHEVLGWRIYTKQPDGMWKFQMSTMNIKSLTEKK